MAAMNYRVVTVFGGTGFLGRRVVRHLRNGEFSVRIASRHPERGKKLFGSDDPRLQSVDANIHDERSVADALAGAYGVVNAVSLYVEHGRETFHSVHVESARRVAAQAHRAGVERLVHVSGIGSDAASPSLYIRKRGEGELAVRTAFADATLIRPAGMCGPDETHTITYECGGPRVYSYEEFLRAVAHEAGLRPILIPLPFGAWHALAWASEMLPSPPVTRNQVELMQVDNVSSPEMRGFGDLGISPHSVEEIFQEMLSDH